MLGAVATQALPFVPTTDPQSPTTKWYFLKTGSLYIYSNIYNYDDLDVAWQLSTENDYLWCFVGTEATGYKLFNRARQRYMAGGWNVNDAGNGSDVNYVETGSGNSFYIYYTLIRQKLYLNYDSENGFTGNDTKSSSYTVEEYNMQPMVVTPYRQLTPINFNIPQNSNDNFGNLGIPSLFDKDRTTKWSVSRSSSWQTVTVDFKSDVPFTPDAYYLTTASDANNNPNKNPKAWKIYAKAKFNDEWTMLASVTDGESAGLGTANMTDYKFDLNGISKAYQYFRFEVSQVRGSSVLQLAELQFSGKKAVETGDVNGDGVVSGADVTALYNVLLDGATASGNADVNGDGVVSGADVTSLYNILLNGQQTPTIDAVTTTYTVNGVSFKMVEVKGGLFLMGDPDTDNYMNYASRPTHYVMLSDYSIGVTEVTQELWSAVMGGSTFYFSQNYGYTNDPQRPAEWFVSWQKSQEFITKLNNLTGQHFRLPTEAEWEFAARGGNLSRGYKHVGSNDIDEVAWHRNNCDSQTHPVATKKPNELGIYDMEGNVQEWCQDWYGNYSSNAQTNPTGPSSGEYRVVRGSAYNLVPSFNYLYRFSQAPETSSASQGLRLAK